MEAKGISELLYQGTGGYVWAKRVTHNEKQGALLYYGNPDSRKLHAIDVQGMEELETGVATLEATPGLDFCIFYGAYDPVHAGADITQFAGDPDFSAIKQHLYRGTDLDTRVKALWSKMRTVSIICGDRYGGSVEWPLFAEWAVADNHARIQFTEVHLGIIPGWNGVLNSVLRTHPANARNMAQTGNPVDAVKMEKMGFTQTTVENPAPPDRRKTPKEEWPAVWSAHAEICQKRLLEAALELATQTAAPRRATGFRISTDEELADEIRRRTDPGPYRSLRMQAEQELGRLDPETQADQVKELSREFAAQLRRLGKPLAPKAVSAVASYVQRWSALPAEQLLKRWDEIGRAEADLCDQLMRTEHRSIGVNAVLSRSPAERIPVFA